jgi:protein O-mannosyl-transferase
MSVAERLDSGLHFGKQRMKTPKVRMLHRLWPYVLVATLAFLSYLPSLSGEFILDDQPLVKDNLFLRAPQGMGSYFSQEDGVTHVYRGEKIHTGYYRPLINMTYRLDYLLWGMNARGFRATNLALHILASLALFSLLLRFSGDRAASFLGALLFALHPVNSEAVSWISSRNNILVTLFSLLAVRFHVSAWEEKRRGAFALSTLFLGAALCSKEFGILVLPLLFLYHRLPGRGAGNTALEAVSYLPLVLVLLLYFWLRSGAVGVFLSPAAGSAGVLERICYAPYLLLLNAVLFLFPHGLHSFIVGYPDGLFTWQALAGFVFLFLCLLLLWKCRRRGMPAFGVAGFILTLVPVLNIIPTSSVSLVSMRWLYLPAAFLVFALTDAVSLLLRKNRLVTTALCLAAAAYLGGYTWTLNAHFWHDETGFFRQEVLRFGNLHYAGGLAEKLQETEHI